VELYIFGNKYNIPRIQNVTINEIISLFHEQFAFPRASTIDKIYELTSQGAPLRRLVTDMVVLSHENVEALIDGQSRFGDGFHSDFIQDLVKKLYRAANHKKGYHDQRLTRQQWAKVSRCHYHVSEVSARSNGKKVGLSIVISVTHANPFQTLARSHAEGLP
jgi:TolB-like protein